MGLAEPGADEDRRNGMGLSKLSDDMSGFIGSTIPEFGNLFEKYPN